MQRDMTPMQRFVYIMAKDFHTPDEAKTKPKPPSDVQQAQQMTQGF